MTMQALLTIGKAFSEPVRVRIIALLKGGELCVCELCDVLELPQSTLSTHLQYLRQTGLVETRQDGKWVYYTLAKSLLAASRALFRLHQRELSGDPLIKADARKLKQRLAKRGKDGTCCVGFVKPRAGRMPGRRAACCSS
jgi:ArsR family transcriptional regulator